MLPSVYLISTCQPSTAGGSGAGATSWSGRPAGAADGTGLATAEEETKRASMAEKTPCRRELKESFISLTII
ncbi:MAG: hypothetical protein II375_07755 [Bacteroidales bacterium]|nr:hypothetical protein [Bacteroidales bacterium]